MTCRNYLLDYSETVLSRHQRSGSQDTMDRRSPSFQRHVRTFRPRHFTQSFLLSFAVSLLVLSQTLQLQNARVFCDLVQVDEGNPKQDLPPTEETSQRKDEDDSSSTQTQDSIDPLADDTIPVNPQLRDEEASDDEKALALPDMTELDLMQLEQAQSTLFSQAIIKPDYQKQVYMMLERLANEFASPEAQLYLGFMHAIGLGTPLNQAKALVYYTIAASGNSTLASMILAYRRWSGVTFPTNCENSLLHYRKVAKKVEEGVSFSASNVIQRVRLYDELENPGSFSAVLDDDLIQYYQFLADKGDVQAQVGLGQLHFQGGRGVEQDHSKALHYFTLAAEAGNANAMAFLGKVSLIEPLIDL